MRSRNCARRRVRGKDSAQPVAALTDGWGERRDCGPIDGASRDFRKFMSLESSVSGRACFLQWQYEITVTSVFALLNELNRVRRLAGKPVIAILHVGASIRTPGQHVLESLKGGLASVV